MDEAVFIEPSNGIWNRTVLQEDAETEMYWTA
jgi:hypothetical protein